MIQLVRVTVSGGQVGYVNRDLVAALKGHGADFTDVLLSGSGVITVDGSIDELARQLRGEVG